MSKGKRTKLDTSGACQPNEGGQALFCADWSNLFVALEGGWGSGKTWAGASKTITGHIHNAFDANGEATYVPSAAIAPTYGQISDFIIPALAEAAEQSGLRMTYKASGSIGEGGSLSAPAIMFPDLGTKRKPSAIMLRSADCPDKITGWEVGFAWGDEVARWKEDKVNPKRDPLIQLIGRVRHKRAKLLQMIFTYTNEGDHTRVYNEFHSGKPRHALYRAPTRENPLMGGFLETLADQLTPELYEQYAGGSAIQLKGGKVYPCFDSKPGGRNVDDSLMLRTDLPLQVTFDFNIAPGMHGVVGQYDPKSDLFTCIYEIHDRGMDIVAAVNYLGKLITDTGGWRFPGELEVFGDPAGSARSCQTGVTHWHIVGEALKAANIRYRFKVKAAAPLITDRVNAMNVAMFDVRGKAHWKVHPRCKILIRDLVEMRRDEFGEVDKRDQKLSHASEAEGYRVHYTRPIRRPTLEAGGRVVLAGAAY